MKIFSTVALAISLTVASTYATAQEFRMLAGWDNNDPAVKESSIRLSKVSRPPQKDG
jgi:hypothetical protein